MDRSWRNQQTHSTGKDHKGHYTGFKQRNIVAHLRNGEMHSTKRKGLIGNLLGHETLVFSSLGGRVSPARQACGGLKPGSLT